MPLVILDGGLRVVTANRSFYEIFHVTPEETERRLVYELGNHQWDIPRLRTLLEERLAAQGLTPPDATPWAILGFFALFGTLALARVPR